MTTPITESESAPNASQPKAESFMDWFHVNSRTVALAAAALVVVCIAAWGVQRTALNASINSDKMLQIAKQSLNSGNAPLAESDLKKVVDKYAEKPAGVEAGLLLAQLQFDKSDYAAAAAGLNDLSKKVGADPLGAPVVAMLGDANMQMGKPADAAVQYEKAAAMTILVGQKNYYLGKAGRAYLTAGNNAQARKLYEGLANQDANDASTVEARVRLGEMVTGGKA